jgi:hypothetical protein
MDRVPALCCCLLVLFCGNLAAAPPVEQVSKWPEGKRIQVVFNSGEKAIGRLGRTTPGAFILNPDRKGKATAREIRFAEVRSVHSKWTAGQKWLLAGVIYAGLTTLSALTLGY